ncbi:MAG: hypothetical protein AB1Z98_17445, partial [Nannocystaceae bacterium]
GTLPVDKSPLERGDLGTDPPALADALMANSRAPGISHRITLACAGKGALAGTASVALRWTVPESGSGAGSIEGLEGDPPGEAARCLAGQLRTELADLEGLPAGAALLLLTFHTATPR